jgi:Na+:H+ antiporter, NhaA family
MKFQPIIAKPSSALRVFFASETAGGLLLMISAAAALLLANSPWASVYFAGLHHATGPILSEKLGPMTIHLWINDGLMALFFLLVGLEVKREFVDGHLASWSDRRLPIIAAAAGMIAPALVYIFIAGHEPDLLRGWAIPAATDIAFAMAILALVGPRAPTSLKLLLVTIAIVDDIGAVAIIAAFYTQELNLFALAAAAAIAAMMMILNRRGVTRLMPYLIMAALLWYAVFLSGVHATIAGVIAAFTIPLRRTLAAPDAQDSALHRLEHALARPVAFLVVPVFGFANAGVALSGISAASLLAPLPLGIALGLFLGKQAGIFASVWLSVRLGIAARPKDASWMQVYGIALLCGIGFTMSLFIGGLAFADPARNDAVKIGVLMGSMAAALAGWMVLRLAPKTPQEPD